MSDVVERLRALDYNVDVAMYWHDPECLPEAADEIGRLREACFKGRHRLLKEGFSPDDPTVRALNAALKGNQ